MGTRSRSVEVRGRVGYLSGELALGELALYEHLTGRELLDYIANLRGLRDRGSPASCASAWNSTRAATSRTCPGETGRDSAWCSRSSTGSSARPRPRGGRCSCPPMSCPRSSAWPTGWRSFAMVGSSTCRVGTLKTHALRRFELDFARPVPAAVFERLPAWSRW